MSTHDSESAVIGLDIGGTSTTAAVLAGRRVVSLVRGPGANPMSSPGDHSVQLTNLLATAVSRAGEVEVTACVAGVSGGGPAGEARAQELLLTAVRGAGLAPDVLDVLPDPAVAFAAGSPSPDGSLLLAGTGAIACRYEGFEQRERADGLGWMLGDVGGGVWLALEGLREAVAALDGRGPQTTLVDPARMFAEEAGVQTGDVRQDLVKLTGQRSPAELGVFSRTVTEHASAGDAVAQGIVERGARGLLGSLEAVDDGVNPVVLAGSVLTAPGPVRDHVRDALAGRGRDAGQPVVGALRLAANRAGWPAPTVDDLDLAVVEAVEAEPSSRGLGSESPDSPQEQLSVDAYRPEDRETLYEICLRTGDSGADARGLYQDGDLLGHVYLGAYLEFAPHLARVLRRPDGVAVGYCVAVADTADFEDWCEKAWWPPLREQHTEPMEPDDSHDARLIRMIHRPGRTNQPWLAGLPAHLHIDLLPEAQGGGHGGRLLEVTLGALTDAGARGVHLGVGGRNVGAIGFYEHMGLRTVEHLTWGLTMGASLPLRRR